MKRLQRNYQRAKCNNAAVRSHCGNHQSGLFSVAQLSKELSRPACVAETLRNNNSTNNGEGEVTNHRRRLLMLRDNAGRHGNGHAPALNVCDCSSSTASSVDELRDLPSVCSAASCTPLHARYARIETADGRCDGRLFP